MWDAGRTFQLYVRGWLADGGEMQRMRVWLAFSIALNAALAAGWFFATRPPAVKRAAIVRRPVFNTNVVRLVRTNIVVPEATLGWSSIESDDYFTYIQNLRTIGCPEQTIRDIIVADVNQLFARRQSKAHKSTNEKWWLSDPDLDDIQAATEEQDSRDQERRQLLTALLGPGWETQEDLGVVPNTNVTLDGHLLGDLSPETKRAVRDIQLRNQQRQEAYGKAVREGKAVENPAELAKMRKEAREELAKVLTPDQLEEYLLRYSNNANDMREQLRGFGASQEEFRAIFRATDSLDLEREALIGSENPDDQRRLRQIDDQRDEALRKALTPERYQYYKLNSDPGFKEARELVQDLGAPADAVMPFYEVQNAIREERQKILADNTLTPEEQTQQLGQVHQDHLDTLRKVLGEAGLRRYLQGLGK